MSPLIFVMIFLFWKNTSHVQALAELQPEDKDFFSFESLIRDTTNKLFSSFNLKGIDDTQKAKDYLKAHDYFVSISKKDYDNLMEISDITKVANQIDNSTANFMAKIDDSIKEQLGKTNNETSGHYDNATTHFISTIDTLINEEIDKINNGILEINIEKRIEDFLNNIKILKNKYDVDNKHLTLNKEVLGYLNNADELHDSVGDKDKSEENVTVVDDLETWAPSGRRIYKGHRTKIKHFPFMAGILMFNSFACAGSIIKSDLIITATSCIQIAWNNRFFRENPAFLSVRVGSSFYNGGGEVIPVLEIYFHPSYDPKNLKHNLSILRLVRRLSFSRRNRRRVKKIEFDKRPSSLSIFTEGITVVGWGAKTAGNTLNDPWNNILSFDIINAYPLDECQQIYSRQYVTNNHFCGGYMSKGSGACNRDVGGPGIVDGILMGVISFGSPVCGAPDTPTVFIKLGHYRRWIEDVMKLEVPHSKKRTTLQTPREYYIPTQSHTSPKLYITPITPEPGYLYTENVLREEPLFLDFLKTIFTSKELDTYNDWINKGEMTETKSKEQNIVDTPISSVVTEATDDINIGTIMGNFEPVTENEISLEVSLENGVNILLNNNDTHSIIDEDNDNIQIEFNKVINLQGANLNSKNIDHNIVNNNITIEKLLKENLNSADLSIEITTKKSKVRLKNKTNNENSERDKTSLVKLVVNDVTDDQRVYQNNVHRDNVKMKKQIDTVDSVSPKKVRKKKLYLNELFGSEKDSKREDDPFFTVLLVSSSEDNNITKLAKHLNLLAKRNDEISQLIANRNNEKEKSVARIKGKDKKLIANRKKTNGYTNIGMRDEKLNVNETKLISRNIKLMENLLSMTNMSESSLTEEDGAVGMTIDAV